MANNDIKIEDLKLFIQQINLTNEQSIKNRDHDLSQRVENFLDQTKKIPDEKLKDILTPELSKLVKEIEDKFGPVINDQPNLRKKIDDYPQTTTEQVKHKDHVIQSPGGGEKEIISNQEKIENTQSQSQKIQQNMNEPAKIGGMAMAINAAMIGGMKAIEISSELGKKLKNALDNKTNNTVRKEDIVLSNLQLSAETAQKSMKHFMENIANKVERKIQQEAKNHPEGREGVIHDMTKKGKQASLYKEMNQIKNKNPEAWKNVTESIQNFNETRKNAIETFKNSGPFYQEKITKLDADVGMIAKNIPGEEGKSLLEEFGEKVKQIVEKAIKVVNQLLEHKVKINNNPSTSPSPSF